MSDQYYNDCLAPSCVSRLLDRLPDPLFERHTNHYTANYNNLVDPEPCRADSCQNSGICVQIWPAITCQCEMTSFTGPRCSDGNVAISQCYMRLS